MTLPEGMTSETSLPETTLREMTWRDIPALSAIEPVLFADDPWSQQSWWAELAGRPRRSYVVCEQSGTLVGYAGVDCGGQVADVMTVAVTAPAQGHGLGAVLLHWLIAEAQRCGAQHLMLEVRADNVVAQRLYHATGFSTLSVRRKYYQPGDVDALIMRMHLWDMTDDAAEDADDSPAQNLPQDRSQEVPQ
jgi:ribosomal-protein-alanine N-acetyltransferase